VKHYRDAPGADASFGKDAQFAEALERFVLPAQIDTVIETGTFVGLGSTKVLAEFFRRTRPPKAFTTIEVNFAFFQRAKANLRPYGFVDCRWGETINRADALRFVREDEAIRNHRAYEDIWIDDVDDPVAFYTAELSGRMLGQYPQTGYRRARHAAKEALSRLASRYGIGNFDFLWDGSDLLARFCAIHRQHEPLIVLDSSGGIGYLEFQTVLKTMGSAKYMLLLDDICHLKHFRSLRDMKADASFEILALDQEHGWALARHDAGA
jgi:hypothetical protein